MMPRYIDADKLLARYKERCAGCKETKNYCEHCCDLADVIDDIEDEPTVDAVAVVRCKDCKWFLSEEHCCNYLYLVTEKDNYCSLGERKEKTDA